jgi:amino acid permease
MSLFPIYNEMKTRTEHKMNFVVNIAIAISAVCFVA